MMSIDRTLAPAFDQVKDVPLLEATKTNWKNTPETFLINAGSQPVIRLEVVFNAGTVNQQKPLVASTANALIKEGLPGMNAQEIAELFDFYGAHLENNIEKHQASLVLYSLNKHLPEVLPIFKRLLTEATIPQHEFDLYIKNQKQKHLVNLKKVDFVGRTVFPSLLFGEDHPYGAYASTADYDQIQREEVYAFYKNNYQLANAYILIAGSVDNDTEKLLESHLQCSEIKTTNKDLFSNNITVKAPEKKLLLRDDAIQSAIRVGRVLFNKTHADFFGFQVLNTILGGYFGSRLMSNIREDKGYTYGIGSGLLSLKHSGIFFITTEVGVDVCQNALKEIYFELQRLRDEPVGDEELSIVQNYMTGVFLRSADGAFALADKFKGIHDFDLSYDYYKKYIAAIRTTTPASLQALAQKYLQEKDLTELVVGKK